MREHHIAPLTSPAFRALFADDVPCRGIILDRMMPATIVRDAVASAAVSRGLSRFSPQPVADAPAASLRERAVGDPG